MRWQWRDMVRTRDWAAMEALARSEPSSQLCDTVNELANGLEDKADIKRARRILYFLREAGFKPTVLEDVDTGYDPPTPLRYGLIGTTDEEGFSEVGLVTVENGRLHWVFADVNFTAGCAHIRSEEHPRERAGDVRFQMLHKPQKVRYLVEAPFDYCLGKLAFVRKNLFNHPGNDLSPLWAERLDQAPRPRYHLLDEVDVSLAGDDESIETVDCDPFSAQWRLVFFAKIHPQLCAALTQIESRRLGPEERTQARFATIQEHRDEWNTQRFSHDSVWRCLDMAWAMHTKGRYSDRDRFCRLAVRIANGPDPVGFFDALARKAAERLDDVLEDHIFDTKHRLFAGAKAA